MDTAPRKLVSLRVVHDLYPIRSTLNKQYIAEIDGWSCVVDAGKFRVGQLALYFEIDCFLPESDPRFAGLGSISTFKGERGHRIQTKVFGRGGNVVTSQGILMRLENFPEVHEPIKKLRDDLDFMDNKAFNAIVMFWQGNWDFSTDIGVTKWEAPAISATPDPGAAIPAPVAASTLGGFPTWLCKKSDHSRVQDCPNLFVSAKYRNAVFQESVKMDGASMTVYFVSKSSAELYASLRELPRGQGEVGPNTVLPNGRFGVCSHHVELAERGGGFFWEAALRNDLPRKMAALGRDVAVQGELVGDKVAENREGFGAGERDFYVFAVWDIKAGRHMHPRVAEQRAKELGLKHVPVLGYVKLWEIAKSREDLLQRATRRKGEGLVFKNVRDGRWFKVHSNTYLLEHRL
ncbi:hypothetical protein NKR23_g8559 [Pleurostoma richardsiae]|uniref:RNA ligase domain-containing protein n=1 Tax=Pleurostoma richardsiae TaxID=41990 RepID=A0AA38VFL5_9PEZI|nr:hypothetical protein NKR23_g8559 [Pleurostoma richardsiae]